MKNLIYQYNINKAYMYKPNDIKPVGKSTYADEIKYDFLVNSLLKEKKEFTKIGIKNNNLSSLYCSCYEFEQTHSCEHIPAVILNYENYLIPQSNQKKLINKSREILKLFSQKRTKTKKKN